MCGDLRSGAAACLLTVASIAAAGCHAIFGPSSAGDTNWRVRESVHVSLFVRPDSFADTNASRLAEVLDDQYSFTKSALALAYAGHPAVYLYNSGTDAGLEGDRSGTAYALTESCRVVCVPPFDDNLVSLVDHELNHVVIIGGLGNAGTSFVTEGLASAMLSEHYAKVGRTFLYSWTRTHRSSLPRVATLMDDDNWPRGETNTSYSTAASFLLYLHETYGTQRLREVYGATSGNLPAKIAQVYGRSVDALEEDWLRFCDQQP